MFQSVWSAYKLGAHPMPLESPGRQSDPQSLKHKQTRLFVWQLSAGTCMATSISGTNRTRHKDNQLPFSVSRLQGQLPILRQVPHRSDNLRSMSGTYISLSIVHLISSALIFFLWRYSPILGLARLHETFRFISVTRSRRVGRTPWTGDQLVARPLLTAPGDCDDDEVGGMNGFGGGNRSTRRKPAPKPLCPPQSLLARPGREHGPPRCEASD
jgi:hypothetical protein